jgi:hypothetical protein
MSASREKGPDVSSSSIDRTIRPHRVPSVWTASLVFTWPVPFSFVNLSAYFSSFNFTRIIFGPHSKRPVKMPSNFSDVIERQFPESLSPFLCVTSITQYSDEDGGSEQMSILFGPLTGPSDMQNCLSARRQTSIYGPSNFCFSIPSSHFTKFFTPATPAGELANEKPVPYTHPLRADEMKFMNSYYYRSISVFYPPLQFGRFGSIRGVHSVQCPRPHLQRPPYPLPLAITLPIFHKIIITFDRRFATLSPSIPAISVLFFSFARN